MEKPAAHPRRRRIDFQTNAKIPTRGAQRWALITPVLAMIALAVLMGVTIWYLTDSEESQREQALMRDVESMQRTIREKLRVNQTELSELATPFAIAPSATELRRLSIGFLSKNPEVSYLAWVDQDQIIRGVYTSARWPRQSFGSVGSKLARSASLDAYANAINLKQPSYSSAMQRREGDVEVDLHIPLLIDDTPQGTLVATYSLPAVLLGSLPADVSNRLAFSLVDPNGDFVAQTRATAVFSGKSFHEVSLDPLSRAIKLRGYNLLPVSSPFNDIVITLIAGLITLAVIGQIQIWRNTRRRLGVERELAEETAFRRAMENSMSTGMRVIDLTGVITYVNPAFCRMVGFTNSELTGCAPPYPYWPPESQQQLTQNLQGMLSGAIPPSAQPLLIMRKDGTRLTVRMYTSPLIDQNGKQTGWMTSVTDISEQNRIRQELAQAQERFITVLQALDAAVSVATPSPQDELLFANQAYKKWFGNSLVNGHRDLCAGARGPWFDVKEVYSPAVQRWFEVRVRNIQWVDGRDVELMVATDITQERATEQAQREQHNRIQQTARLITMGEMASSLAHELNQPLTAIANYTSGATSRVRAAAARGEQVPSDDLIDMLSKTARQAERAGQVIRRIRGFVKRSDPIRKEIEATTILADALVLAEIDARERGLQIAQEIEPNLPKLNVDGILIEQVLMNLLKNGLEAMKDSQERTLVVSVTHDGHQVMFSVKDRGHGVPSSISGMLFDSFYTTKDDGMGMGLNICRSIIESHHGRLWFENNPEGGCTFRFTLPVSAATPPETQLTQSEAPNT
ncbi:PAS domain S-box protein [beta proteobacterium MWH-UniP1]